MRTGSLQGAEWERMTDTAADWRVRHDAGLTPADEKEFAHWLAASPQHAAAWRDVNATDQMLSRIRSYALADEVVLASLRRRRQQTRRRLWWAMLALPAAAIWLFLVKVVPETATEPTTHAATAAPVRIAESIPTVGNSSNVAVLSESVLPVSRIVRPETLTLKDGSQIELRAGARVETHYTDTRRDVVLLEGEAYFIVAKDAERPFVVRSGQVKVRAVGTRFAVQSASLGVNVLVTEGRVTVASSPAGTTDDKMSDSEQSVMLGQGNEIQVSSQNNTLARPRSTSTAEIEQRLAWRKSRLLLANVTLAETVELLDSEGGLRVAIRDAKLAPLRLTGSCYTDDAGAFVRLIEAALPVRCQQRADGVIEIDEKRGPGPQPLESSQ